MFHAVRALLKATYEALEPSDEEAPDDTEAWTHQERLNDDQEEEDWRNHEKSND